MLNMLQINKKIRFSSSSGTTCSKVHSKQFTMKHSSTFSMNDKLILCLCVEVEGSLVIFQVYRLISVCHVHQCVIKFTLRIFITIFQQIRESIFCLCHVHHCNVNFNDKLQSSNKNHPHY